MMYLGLVFPEVSKLPALVTAVMALVISFMLVRFEIICRVKSLEAYFVTSTVKKR